jgi:hypothetical protein
MRASCKLKTTAVKAKSFSLGSSSSPSLRKFRSSADDLLYFSPSGTDAFVKRMEGDFQKLAEYTLTGNIFSMPQLVILVNVVNRQKPDYEVFGYQCYWFASLLVEVIKGHCPVGAIQEKLSKDSARRGRVWTEMVLQPNFTRKVEQEKEAFIQKFRGAWFEYAGETQGIRDTEQKRQAQVSLHPFLDR